jgi:Icc-related predicted phosphoesterase
LLIAAQIREAFAMAFRNQQRAFQVPQQQNVCVTAQPPSFVAAVAPTPCVPLQTGQLVGTVSKEVSGQGILSQTPPTESQSLQMDTFAATTGAGQPAVPFQTSGRQGLHVFAQQDPLATPMGQLPCDHAQPNGSSTVRLLHLSDTHGLHRTLERQYPLSSADILLHTGDFTDHGTDDEFADFNEWLGGLRSRFKYIVIIAGNHEWKAVEKAKHVSEIPVCIKDGSFLSREYLKDRLPNATHVLDHELVEIMGIRIYGSSWCPWHAKEDLDNHVLTQQRPGLALAYRKWLEKGGIERCRFHEIPNNVDVLLTHGAARGILDRMEGTLNAYGSSQVLKDIIQRRRPQVHLFGHIHEQRGHWIRTPRGNFYGGVEYQPAAGVPWNSYQGPTPEYPCQLVACTALKNHNGLDGAGSCLVAPARLILAEGAPGAWSFSLGGMDAESQFGEAAENQATSKAGARLPSLFNLCWNNGSSEAVARHQETWPSNSGVVAGAVKISDNTYQRWLAESMF